MPHCEVLIEMSFFNREQIGQAHVVSCDPEDITALHVSSVRQ